MGKLKCGICGRSDPGTLKRAKNMDLYAHLGCLIAYEKGVKVGEEKAKAPVIIKARK